MKNFFEGSLDPKIISWGVDLIYHKILIVDLKKSQEIVSLHVCFIVLFLYCLVKKDFFKKG